MILPRRLCRCGHTRRVHSSAWGWTSCDLGCGCPQWRWVRAARWWDWRYRRAGLTRG